MRTHCSTKKNRAKVLAAVEQSANIKVVYELHQALQEIWAKRGGNVDEVIAELGEWCKRAEASGIQALGDFADTLKSYATPAPASA